VLPLAVAGGASQAGSLLRAGVNRILGIPELIGSLAGLRAEKRLRIRVVVVRDEEGEPILAEDALADALAETERVLRAEAGIRVEPLAGRLVETLDEPAPPEALDAPCRDSGLWLTDLGPAGRWFRRHSARHGLRSFVGLGAPVTVFVVRDVVGKCGCSLGPLGDYVTIDRDGVRPRTLRILPHELAHSCGLRHSSRENNLMRPRGQGERLTRWQRAVLRSSRHVTYL
jgi:hypothetical protein